MLTIVKGERIQKLCDVYLGLDEDFRYNPCIFPEKSKHIDLTKLNSEYDNPRILFCYSHRIDLLSKKISFLKNKFLLFTHNSDGEIRNTVDVENILNCSNLIHWYAQNVCIQNEKLSPIPIGFANDMWPHGNISILNETFNKTNNVYFNFNIATNRSKREPCFNALKNKLEWLPLISSSENMKRLASYKFCICPEGNGVDTHRLSECYYLKVIPIVMMSPFIKTLQKYNIPMIILNSWEELDPNTLEYKFNETEYYNLNTYTRIIENARSSSY
jgi:hypothetical protein